MEVIHFVARPRRRRQPAAANISSAKVVGSGTADNRDAAFTIFGTSRDLYCIKGAAAALMHAAQLSGLAHATSAARQVGVDRITGVRSFIEWLGDGPVSPEPEAQGPALDREGLANPKGPFTASRHPLNFSPLPILWLWPRMTTSLLAFNAAATVYLIIGSKHEESRLRDAYGESYDAYRESGVPFYFPNALPHADELRVERAQSE